MDEDWHVYQSSSISMPPISRVVTAFAALAVPLSAFAAPSVSVTRTPSSWAVWDAYSVTWSTSWAAKLGYRCTWAWSNSADDMSAGGLWLNGTVSGKYDESMVWTTNCVWTATASDGTTASFSESFTATRAAATPFANFAISKIASSPYSGSPVVLSNWSRSFVIEGTGAPGADIIVSSAGCVYLNRSANADGSWSVTVADEWACKLPQSGAFQFSVTASKAYYGEAVRYASVTFPATSASEMGKIQCRAGSEYADTNFYAKRGESVTCTVSANDAKTRLMMDSGYTSWGDVDSTKIVQPQTVTEIPTSCQGGACTATFVSDYAGYSKSRNVWFQNSSGTKSASISYVSADPASQDYADAVAYLNKKYQSGSSSTQSSGTSTTGAKITSVNGARFSNGKITASEGSSFTVDGIAAKRSQMRIYRKGWDSDGVSGGVDDSGKWSAYGLWTKWYPKVFKTGSNQYVFEFTGTDGKQASVTVEIEIVASATTSTSTSGTATSGTTGQSTTSSRQTSQENGSTAQNSGNGSSSAETRTQASATISPELKTKLDAFLVILENRTKAKRDTKASYEYVTAVREKLVALKAKYRKSWKYSSAAAISYLIEKTDSVVKKYAPQDDEETLVKELKESY